MKRNRLLMRVTIIGAFLLGIVLLKWAHSYSLTVFTEKYIRLKNRIEQFKEDVSGVYSSLKDETAILKKDHSLCQRYDVEPKNKKLALKNVWGDIHTYNVADVTYATQLNKGHLAAFTKVLQHWTGPVSFTYFLDYEELDDLPWKLLHLKPLRERNNIDVHLVLNTTEFYPVNFLRNTAVEGAHTDYVFTADVDFIPSIGMHRKLKAHIMAGEMYNHSVFIVPGFESFQPLPRFPADKRELVKMYSQKKLQPFHIDMYGGIGHGPTDFQKWVKVDKTYKIQPQGNFEPYFVIRKQDVPRYPEQFPHPYYDKISHCYLVYARGFDLLVPPDVFTIHMPHPRRKALPHEKCAGKQWKAFHAWLIKTFPGTMQKYNFHPKANYTRWLEGNVPTA